MARATLDLALSIGELCKQEPVLPDLLDEIGFDELQDDLTIPQLAKQSGVRMGVVVMALRMNDFALLNYKPDPSETQQLLENLAKLIEKNEHSHDHDGQQVHGQRAYSHEESSMVAHMEAAIAQAQADGRLPKLN